MRSSGSGPWIGTSNLLHAVPHWLIDPDGFGLGRWFLFFWISRALGLAVLAPLPLVTATDSLVRRGLAAEEPPDAQGEWRGLVPQARNRKRLAPAPMQAGAKST